MSLNRRQAFAAETPHHSVDMRPALPKHDRHQFLSQRKRERGAGGPHLYRNQLIDMTSLVEGVEKKYGKVSVIGRQIAYNMDSKTWSAFPDYYINNPTRRWAWATASR